MMIKVKSGDFVSVLHIIKISPVHHEENLACLYLSGNRSEMMDCSFADAVAKVSLELDKLFNPER